MFRSIIIPNRDYTRYLDHCLWSLQRSAEYCGLTGKDVEMVIVDEQSGAPTPWTGNTIVVPREGRYFNKPRLLNIGIEQARGDVLTFLDADAIVGIRFLDAVRALSDLSLTKLCYRVRYLPTVACQQLADSSADTKEVLVGGWFHKWPSFDVAFEGYGAAETRRAPHEIQGGETVFGNSQFSIRRETLGGLRFDEQYAGRGYEDVEMNRRLHRHYGPDYRAEMVTDPDQAMFHIRNTYQGELWGPGEQNSQNQQRYART